MLFYLIFQFIIYNLYRTETPKKILSLLHSDFNYKLLLNEDMQYYTTNDNINVTDD